jgi:hypothetical protein
VAGKASGADDSSRHLEENWFEIGVEKLFRGGTILTTAILLVPEEPTGSSI